MSYTNTSISFNGKIMTDGINAGVLSNSSIEFLYS